MSSENQFVLQSSSLPQNSFQFFLDLKNKGELCDVVLKIRDVTISAHSIVVLAAIPYLEKTLSDAPVQNGRKEIDISEDDGIEPIALQSLIDFAYHSEITGNTESVMSLLRAAFRFQVNEVRDECCEFLKNNLNSQNVISVRSLANQLECMDLANCADCFIAQNFLSISASDSFLDCSFDFVKDLVERDDLQVESEEVVFDSVIRWINRSPEERTSYLYDLFTKVRLPLLSLEYLLEHVTFDPLISNCEKCRHLVNYATSYLALKKDQYLHPSFITTARGYVKTESNTNNERCENDNSNVTCEGDEETVQPERDSLGDEENTAGGIFAIHAQMTFTLQRFDNKTNQWEIKKTESLTIDTASVANMENKMCIVDGDNVYYYTPEDNEFNFSQMCTKGRAFTAIGNELYVFGGTDGRRIFDAADCFDSEEEDWRELECMEEKRGYASSVLLEELIYVTGGNDLEKVHDSVERYNPQTNKWKTVEPMLTKRSGHGSAVLNYRIYVCGGVSSLDDDAECDCSAEVYDPFDKQWTYIAPLNKARWALHLVPHMGKLHVLGGRNSSFDYEHDTEVYDPEPDEWLAGTRMATELEMTGVAALTAISSCENY